MGLPHVVRIAVIGLALLAGTALIAGAADSEGGECSKHGKYGKHGKHGHGFGFGHMEDRVDTLGLGEETRKAVQAILDDSREQHRAMKDQMRAARKQMDELLAKPDVTEAELMAQVDADAALHTEAHKAKLRTLLAIRGLVTPEQWEQLRKRPERGEHHHEPESSS
jgi:Spy/CpxP family protein refolding chaperone